ncbi:hypothetical protein EVAR_29644_1 [Eumeta japonica]|uniref:Uncharacterized protein n=1 Tax=Eumeta variegata TaxID=151549 RepID=A0A4C1W956_EUMVA|nr:hypothetical protein EVAR_29644_1 [Eumeta japonica]
MDTCNSRGVTSVLLTSWIRIGYVIEWRDGEEYGESVETSRMTSQTTLIASPSAAGRHMRVPTARDMRYGRRLEEVVSA